MTKHAGSLQIVLRCLTLAVLLLAAACTASPPSGLPASYTPTPGLALEPTVMPAPPASLAPGPTPPPTPALIDTPTPAGLAPISPYSAPQMIMLSSLGKGTIQGRPVFSPDGSLLAVPASTAVYLYDARTWEELPTLPQPAAFLAFSPQGSLLAVSGVGSVVLWDPAAGRRAGELNVPSGSPVWDLTFSPDGSLLAAVTAERQVQFWSLPGGERLFGLPGDQVQFSPDGEMAAVMRYGENDLHLYESATGAQLNQWSALRGGFSPTGQLWLEEQGSVRLLDLERDLVSAPLNGEQASFSMDGTQMALFSNGQIHLYDHQSGRRLQTLAGAYVGAGVLQFSPDGESAAAVMESLLCPACTEQEGVERTLVVWRMEDGEIIQRIPVTSEWMTYSPDGSLLALAEPEDLYILPAGEASILHQLFGFTGPVAGMDLSPDGKSVAAVHVVSPYRLRLWDLESGQVSRLFLGFENTEIARTEVDFSPDSAYLAVGGDLWDISNGTRLTRPEQAISDKTSCWASSVAFAPQGGLLATGCFEGQLDLWSFPTAAIIKQFNCCSGWVNALAFSPVGSRLAAAYGAPEALIHIWELDQHVPSLTLAGGPFTRTVFSPDGSLLAAIAANPKFEQYGQPAGFVKLWDAYLGTETARFDLSDAVSLAFSPSGELLATGSVDGTLRVWEISTGSVLFEAFGHRQSIERLAFTPGGERLVSGSLDGLIAVWGLP